MEVGGWKTRAVGIAISLSPAAAGAPVTSTITAKTVNSTIIPAENPLLRIQSSLLSVECPGQRKDLLNRDNMLRAVDGCQDEGFCS